MGLFWHGPLAFGVKLVTARRAKDVAIHLFFRGSNEVSAKESTVKRVISSVAIASLISACGVTIEQPSAPELKSEPVGGQIHTDTFVQGDLVGGYADILFVVDNSGSMYDDQVRLSQSFDTFINWIVAENVDFHIAITTTDVEASGAKGAFVGTPAVLDNNTPDLINKFKANALVGETGSGYEHGFDPAVAALTEPLASTVNAGFLRSNAKLYVVFVSDEEEQSTMTVPAFVQSMIDAKGGVAERVHFTAITAELNNTCFADYGARYAELMTLTDGLFGSICQADFGTTLQSLGFEVTSASGEYFLTQVPEPSTIEVKVAGVVQPADRWTYHAATNSVELMAQYIPAPGTIITITYEIFGTAPECLANGEVVYDLDGGEYSWKMYCVDIPEGVDKFLVHLWNGKGDADLYLQLGNEPGENDYGWKSVIAGLDETLLLEAPEAGRYHIGVYGFHRYENVNLQPMWIGGDSGEEPTPATPHVVVSQVHYDTPGTDAVEEFIDLSNPTASPAAVGGWSISDNGGTWVIPAGTIIPANGHITIARDAAGHQALYGKAPTISGLTLNLGNTGDYLMLRDGAGNTADFMAWEGASTDWSISAAAGSSLERSDITVDTDREDDWVVRSPASPRG